MKIKENDLLLVIRYSDNYEDDCIKKHIEVLDKEGVVYFGKFGAKPSSKNYNSIMQSENPRIILISKDKAFICDIEDIVFERPSQSYPKYYEEKVFKENVMPSSYFKIKSFYDYGRKNIGAFCVASSLSNLSDALHHSMSSMMLVKAEKDIEVK